MNIKKRSTSHKYRLFWGFVSSITGIKNWNPKKIMFANWRSEKKKKKGQKDEPPTADESKNAFKNA